MTPNHDTERFILNDEDRQTLGFSENLQECSFDDYATLLKHIQYAQNGLDAYDQTQDFMVGRQANSARNHERKNNVLQAMRVVIADTIHLDTDDFDRLLGQ